MMSLATKLRLKIQGQGEHELSITLTNKMPASIDESETSRNFSPAPGA